MDAGLIYQNAKIKSKESELFGKDKIQRLADALSAEEAVRILQEGGYPLGNDPVEVLAQAEAEAALFFKSTVVSGYGLELFLLINDYHNAKVLAKKTYFSGKTDCLKPDGLLDKGKIEEGIEKDDFSSLPSNMAVAFTDIKKHFVDETLTPSYIDITMDKAMFCAIYADLPKAHPVVREYFTRLSDYTNIAVACRAKKAGLPLSIFENMVVKTGELPLPVLKKIFDLGAEESVEKVSGLGAYKKALLAMKEGAAHYETYVDDALLAPIKKARFDMFSPAAVIGFYLGKMREIKNVRLLFAKVNNGVDRDVIKVRMRELYV